MKQFRKLKNSFLSINLVGDQFNFRLRNNQRDPSCLATLLTLCSLIITAVVGYSFIKNVLDTTRPKISTRVKKFNKYPEIDLAQDHFFFAVFPSSAQYNPNPRSYLTLVANINKKSFGRNSEGDIVSYNVEQIPLEVRRCNETDYKSQFSHMIADELPTRTMVRGSICAYAKTPEQIKEYRVKGQPIENSDTFITIEVKPCSLPNPAECVQGFGLFTLNMVFIYPSPDVDLGKKKDMVKWISNGEISVDAKLDVLQEYVIGVKNVEIQDDDRIFGDPRKVVNYTDIDTKFFKIQGRDPNQTYCPPAIINNPYACKPYAVLNLRSGGKTEIVTRQYSNLFEAISEIGGFFELIIIFMGIIFFFLCGEGLIRKIAKDTYGVDDELTRGLVEKNMDITELMKELNAFKLIRSMVLEDYHLALLPELIKEVSRGAPRVSGLSRSREARPSSSEARSFTSKCF